MIPHCSETLLVPSEPLLQDSIKEHWPHSKENSDVLGKVIVLAVILETECHFHDERVLKRAGHKIVAHAEKPSPGH